MSLVRCHADARSAAEACGADILMHLDRAVAERGRATLAISGGSSPKLMFRFFARSGHDWSRVGIYWVDERLVPIDDPRSNYKLARDIWPLPDAIVHRVLTELTPEEAARRYDAELRDAGVFDVIHRGMGSDGHTASLFPGDPLIGDHQGYAAIAAGTPPRVTMLPWVLEAARHTCVLATGADKREMLAKVLSGPYDPMRWPAQIARDNAVWYVDKEAHPC